MATLFGEKHEKSDPSGMGFNPLVFTLRNDLQSWCVQVSGRLYSIYCLCNGSICVVVTTTRTCFYVISCVSLAPCIKMYHDSSHIAVKSHHAAVIKLSKVGMELRDDVRGSIPVNKLEITISPMETHTHTHTCKLSGLFLLYTSICNSTQREREREKTKRQREREFQILTHA